jgi:hypothetical protein
MKTKNLKEDSKNPIKGEWARIEYADFNHETNKWEWSFYYMFKNRDRAWGAWIVLSHEASSMIDEGIRIVDEKGVRRSRFPSA